MLAVVDTAVVALDDTFLRVDAVVFRTTSEIADDTELLGALVRHRAYGHDYASPFDPDSPSLSRIRHGRWWLWDLGPDQFVPCTADEARTTLTRWATEQDWSDSGFVVSDTAWGGLAEVLGWFESATSLYRLVDPGTAHEHNYGFVIGACGFHEFVAIDRANHLVRLVVATDD